MNPAVDVVIPVYRGVAETRRCIDSVLASPQATPHDVVVIDDATPEPEIARYLDLLAQQGRITLLRNERNLGFVQSVNRGMALHAERDVVLLNSDTEVANDWLDRLRAAAYREPDIATVTPLSNNATICSYPFERWDGGVPGTLGLAGLDRLVAAANRGKAIEIPTGVGFCMLIRRDALSQLGAFDAERFGRGYGEECDFCRRAAKAGRRNMLAGDVYVFHQGSVSFSSERAERIEAAHVMILKLHPEYLTEVFRFIHADPAAGLRAAIDAARIVHGAAEAAHVEQERRRREEVLAADRAREAAAIVPPAPPAPARGPMSAGLAIRLLLQMASPSRGRPLRSHVAYLWKREGLRGLARRLTGHQG